MSTVVFVRTDFTPFSCRGDYRQAAVLPTGRFFGRLFQKGPNKSRASGQSCRQILADFVQKGPNFIKYSFPLIFSNSVQIKEKLFLSKARRHRLQNFHQPKCLQKFKFSREPFFFLSQRPTSQKVLPKVGNIVWLTDLQRCEGTVPIHQSHPPPTS